jgi:hypothetical protein
LAWVQGNTIWGGKLSQKLCRISANNRLLGKSQNLNLAAVRLLLKAKIPAAVLQRLETNSMTEIPNFQLWAMARRIHARIEHINVFGLEVDKIKFQIHCRYKQDSTAHQIALAANAKKCRAISGPLGSTMADSSVERIPWAIQRSHNADRPGLEAGQRVSKRASARRVKRDR